jgi:transposase
MRVRRKKEKHWIIRWLKCRGYSNAEISKMLKIPKRTVENNVKGL